MTPGCEDIEVQSEEYEICPDCDGDGEECGAPVDPWEIAVCSTCNGTGRIVCP